MLYLLRLEWMKFRKYRVFQVMIACFLLLLPGSLMIGKSIGDLPPEFGTTEMFYIFPTVWRFLAYIGNWLAFFFLGFLGVISITMEYSNKTLRQNIITGLSRQEVFFSKLIFIAAISLAATVYLILCGLVIGFLHTETIYLSKVTEESGLIIRFFLMCMGYMVFGWLVGTVIRRTGLALFLYLAYIMFIEPVFRWAIHLRYFPGKSMHYYPMNALEDLAPIPFGKVAEQFLKENDFDMFLNPTAASITTIVYLAIFLSFIFWRLKQADL